MSRSGVKRNNAAAPDKYVRRLREMNNALLISSVHQQELTAQAEDASDVLRHSESKLRASNERLERRDVRRTAALSAYQQRLRGLVKELGRAATQERKRIAVELHDNLAQTLVLCKIKVSAIEASAPASSPMALDAVAVKQLLGHAIDYTRTLISDLRPDVLNEYDLLAALQWVGRRMGRFGLVVRVEDDGRPKPLKEELVALIFESVRELLFNVVKHAATDQATVLLSRSDGTVRVTVSDAGRGFEQAPSKQRGFGLFSISERLSMLGGRMEVESSPHHGTKVSLIVLIRPPRKRESARRVARSAARAGPKERR